MDSTNGKADMPKFRSNSIGKAGTAWNVHSVDFKFILASQQWATILLTILCAAVPLVVINWLPSATPRHRPAYMYDATISYPMAAHDSVPAWAAYVVPFILLIITVLVGELLLSRTMHKNITNALAFTVHFIVDAVAASLVAILVQRATKSAVGYLRPDFLARCKPAVLLANDYTFHLEIGSYMDPGCTQTDEALLNDGRSSFPSGHSNMSAVLCTYAAGYFLWTVYMRHRHGVSGASAEQRGWVLFLRKDLCHAVALYWILLMLGISWVIAASRIVDNKHHPADVVAGLLLGGSVAVVFLLRSIPGASSLPRHDTQTEEAQYLRSEEGVNGVAKNRVPEVSEETAERGQHYSSGVNGYHSRENESRRVSGEGVELVGGYPSHPKAYPASIPGNAVHPQPPFARYNAGGAHFGGQQSMGVQHSIPL